MVNRLLIALIAGVFFGVSGAASGEPPTLEDFLREPDTRDVELSPDGKHLAMVLNRDDKRIVIVRNVESPDMPIVGSFGDDIIRPNHLYWANNERLLVVLSVPHKAHRAREHKQEREDFDINDYMMFSRMVAFDVDLGNIAVLLEGERSLRHNRSLSRITNFLPNDIDHVLMTAVRNSRLQQFKVNVNTGKAELVVRGGSRTVRFLNDADGAPRYRLDYLPRSKAIQVYEYKGDDNWRKIDKIYLDDDDEDSLDLDGLLALYEDSLVYRKRSIASGFYELIRVDRETDEVTTLVSLPDKDVRGAIIARDSDEIIGYTIEDDVVRSVYFDERTQARYEQVSGSVEGYNFHVSGVTSDRKTALVRVWGADDPASYHLWNFETEELQYLAKRRHGLAPENLARPAVTNYRARDGQIIRAYLLLPEDFGPDKAHPTIILPHGGPQARSRLAYDNFAQFLATRGYIVVQPNFRGSVGYGFEFEKAGYRQWGGVMQDDLTDAVTFLTKKGYTDPDRVCIVGFSYGGYAALMGAIKTPDLYKCAISLNGVTHLPKILKYDMRNVVEKEDWQAVLFDRIGHPEHDAEMLEANSPALHADKISIPIMLVAGEEDRVVPISQAKLMEKALKKSGVPYEFIKLENTGHNPVYYLDDVEIVFPAVERFLAENLK